MNKFLGKQELRKAPDSSSEIFKADTKKILRRLRELTAVTALAVSQINCAAQRANIDSIQLDEKSSEFWGMDLPEPEKMRKFVIQKINIGGPNYFWEFPSQHLEACNFRNDNWHLIEETTELGGLQGLKWLPEQDLRNQLGNYLDFFPGRSTSKASLDSIVYTNFDFSSEYPGMEGVKSRAVFSRKSRMIKINLSNAMRSETDFMDIITGAIPHEIGHSIDFISNVKLNQTQTLEMLYIILRLLENTERPKFDYVESIKSTVKREQNHVLYGRSVEYFAELTRVALNTPGENWESWKSNLEAELVEKHKSGEEAAEQNARFIKNLFLYMDGQFEPWEAYEKRGEIARKIQERIAEEKGPERLADHQGK
jgi:hypothetical protein